MYAIHELVFTLTSDSLVELQLVMYEESFESQIHSHFALALEGSKPMGQMHSVNSICRCRMESGAFPHGPSA